MNQNPEFSLVWKFDVWMDFAAAAPPPPAPSAYIAQAQQRYQDATLRQSRNINIVENPSTGSDRRLIRQGSVDKCRAVYEANNSDGAGHQSLDRRARKQTSNELDNYRSLDRSKQQQQQNRVLEDHKIY